MEIFKRGGKFRREIRKERFERSGGGEVAGMRTEVGIGGKKGSFGVFFVVIAGNFEREEKFRQNLRFFIQGIGEFLSWRGGGKGSGVGVSFKVDEEIMLGLVAGDIFF